MSTTEELRRCSGPECGAMMPARELVRGKCHACRELVAAVCFPLSEIGVVAPDVHALELEAGNLPLEYDGPQCPSCGMNDRPYTLERFESSSRASFARYVCPECGAKYDVGLWESWRVIFS